MNGSKLKNLRKSNGYTQEELGKLVNVTKVSICCYEKETRTPDLDTLVALCDIFSVSPNYLLDREINILVKEKDEKYQKYMSSEDMEIINCIKKNNELYKLIKDNPKRSIELISKKIL